MARPVKRLILAALCLAVLVGGAVATIRTNDTGNMLYKRYKESDPYVFETLRPELALQDASEFLTINDAAELRNRRTALARRVYGGSADRVAASYHRFSVPSALWDAAQTLSGLKGSSRFYVEPGPGVLSFFYLLTPEAPQAGKALIYHHGFAGDFMQANGFLERMLAEGYTIVAFNQLGYGENSREVQCPGSTDPACEINLQFGLRELENGLAYHVEPVRAGIDLLAFLGFDRIDAVGFSAGAATVALAAALDDRIARSVAAAGILPYYLREGQDAPIGIAEYPPLRELVGMMDLFLLGAAGDGRAQMHLFNRFDRCCFRNVKGRAYEPALTRRLSDLGAGGAFTVRIDETHARHKISDWGADQIVSFLAAPS